MDLMLCHICLCCQTQSDIRGYRSLVQIRVKPDSFRYFKLLLLVACHMFKRRMKFDLRKITFQFNIELSLTV